MKAGFIKQINEELINITYIVEILQQPSISVLVSKIKLKSDEESVAEKLSEDI